MGEAIISRGFSGSSGSSNGSDSKFKTEIITSTTLWRIPDDATGSVSVRIFGGGGAGMNRRGGCGGMMNNTIIDSNELKGTDVYINIGAGGKLLQSSSFGVYSMCGGSSSFGEYISALGGNSFSGGSGGGGCGYDRVLIGGGGGWMNNAVLTINQGDIVQVVIGKGGDGKYIQFGTNKVKYGTMIDGDNGGTTSFGTYLSALGGTGGGKRGYYRAGNGGAGGGIFAYLSVDYSSTFGNGGTGYQFGGGGGNDLGGNGGKWGGGGSGGLHSTAYSSHYVPRGGCLYENSQNMNEITGYSDLGGNGYSNNGKNTTTTNPTNGTNTIGNTEVPESLQGPGFAGNAVYAKEKNAIVGGGGGYGGCGGNFFGGGGGYGANGGNYGGGGGGYGGKGGDYGGGGGSYGPGGDGASNDSITGSISTKDGIFGGGGGGCFNNGQTGNGGDGICIIQYYSA